MNDKIYNVGIYVRLSNDDERAGESVSIENQKMLLRQYVKDKGWNEVSVYSDDGYSGTNFNRPGVQQLIEDAKSKKINVILCKDLSRFGRNYIEIGQYTDYLFPSIGCRFIALNNGIDTMANNSSNEVMSFLNLFNEFYSRDTSKKVKAVKKAYAESGKFLGERPTYGYIRNPKNKHHFIIDEEVVHIVRKIFIMRSQGMSFRSIAFSLNEESITPPGTLYYERKGMSDPRNTSHKWGVTTVKSILRNEAYIGNMVQGKKGTISYKNSKIVAKPQEEWIRAENTHEAIISKELWDIVQELDKKKNKNRTSKEGVLALFSGLLKCADCGFSLKKQTERQPKKDGSISVYISYQCNNYSSHGKHGCTSHAIYENVLIELVTSDIRDKALSVEHDENRLVNIITKERDRTTKSKLAHYEQDLKHQTTRIKELENLMQSLYEDKVNGTIPENTFSTLMMKYEKERVEKTNNIPILQMKIADGKKHNDDIGNWLNIIRKYTQIKTLDRSILLELVEKIEIYEPKKIDGKRICDIKIHYRYIGNIESNEINQEEVNYEQAV